jgi:hypothetical protein
MDVVWGAGHAANTTLPGEAKIVTSDEPQGAIGKSMAM